MHEVDHPPAALRDGWVLWGSELSPFALKIEAMLRHAALPYRWLPAAGSFFDALRWGHRRQRLVAGRLPLTWPVQSELDEFPLVPFLFGPQGENLYDSSAIATWLDAHRPYRNEQATAFVPSKDPAVAFAVRLIDEALDEVGLYMVHHNRWVVAARDNNAGVRLAHEMRPLYGPLATGIQYGFPARQVRRLPYLFSVAPQGSSLWNDLPARLRPPSRTGFPPTHDLLEDMFQQLLAMLETLLARRPYLLGERFTLADASVYGQLGMNRADASACAWIRRVAPTTQGWIDRIAQGDFGAHRGDAELHLDDTLMPLLDWICRSFVPLMQQNHDAWQGHRARGEKLFNEAGFDAGRGLYDGRLLGRPFRSVAKTFQVRVWRDLRRAWEVLEENDRRRLERLLPIGHGLDRDGVDATP